MISFLPESWFPKKQNFDFHTPDRWWISPRIIHDKADDEYGGRLPVHGEPVMTAEYRPVEYGKDYDVVDNPDKFQLYIDGKEIK